MKRRTLIPSPIEAVATVRAIYEELARRPVERSCVRLGECCHFKLTGRTPYLTRGEALAAARGLRASGRTKLANEENGSCPLLDASKQRCLVYEARPFGCRTHFCAAAGGPYARGEVADLIHRLEDVDRMLGGEGARPLRAAVENALEELAR